VSLPRDRSAKEVRSSETPARVRELHDGDPPALLPAEASFARLQKEAATGEGDYVEAGAVSL
jgi:hypothetical protein